MEVLTILSHFLFESFVTSTGTRYLQYSHINVHNVDNVDNVDDILS